MSYVLTVSPDFNTKYISGWFVFNTWIQKKIDKKIHFELFDDFDKQRQAIANDEINLIYSNPYDAASLVRDKGFKAIARPIGKNDEAIIAVNADSDINSIEELVAGSKIATTDDPDVHMMCMIMIEPADLDKDNVEILTKTNFVAVAKSLIQHETDVGFFLAETYDDLSSIIKDQLRVLVKSQINVINHVFLVDPSLEDTSQVILDSLVSMGDDENGQKILSDIGIPGWEKVEEEDVEFMIDLMSTLVS